jgi:2-C-methyl-D-erythritol 4-phosphate cytidylyltransferase
VTPPDDEAPECVASLGVVPVEVGDPSAPSGCAALRELGHRSLLVRAVETLAASGAVSRVLVAAPAGVAARARSALAEVAVGAVAGLDVVPASSTGAGPLLLAALGFAADTTVDEMVDEMVDEIIVVHDPLYPLSPPGLVCAVVRELAGAADAAAAVPAGPVTDTLKWVDHGEVVRDTADRERYRLIGSPQAYRRPALLAALAGGSDDELSGQGPDVLPRVVATGGGRLALVPFAGELLRVGGEHALLLAEALLDVDAGAGWVT